MKDERRSASTELLMFDVPLGASPAETWVRTEPLDVLEGRRIYSRVPFSITGVLTGKIRRCQLEGCVGRRLGVRWDDNRKVTWPCSKGLRGRSDGSLEIV